MILKSIVYGFLGMAVLLSVYFSVVSLISGWQFTLNQLSRFWYFIISLAVGFGIQIGLYTYLKTAVRQKDTYGGVLAISGTTSTATIISCCAHYLVNIFPIIGAAGFISLIGQYQVELFWVGLVFNFLGIIYIGRKVYIFHKL